MAASARCSEQLGRRGVVRVVGDAQVGAEDERHVAGGHGRVELRKDRLGQAHDHVLVDHVGDEHGELVAGELRQQGSIGQHRLDAVPDLDEQPIAGHGAQRVVDLLEGHQVEEDQRDAELAAPRLLDRRLQALVERVRLGSPVTGSCSAWCAFSWASCCSVRDQPAVREGDVGVVGERLEEAQVVVDERADLRQPVGDDHGAHGHPIRRERNDRRILHAHLAQPPRQRLPRLEQP